MIDMDYASFGLGWWPVVFTLFALVVFLFVYRVNSRSYAKERKKIAKKQPCALASLESVYIEDKIKLVVTFAFTLIIFGGFGIAGYISYTKAHKTLNALPYWCIEGRTVTFDNYKEVIRRCNNLLNSEKYFKEYYETKSCAVMEDAYKEAYDLLSKAYGSPSPDKEPWVKFVVAATKHGVVFGNNVVADVEVAGCPHGEWNGADHVATADSFHPYDDLMEETERIITEKEGKLEAETQAKAAREILKGSVVPRDNYRKK